MPRKALSNNILDESLQIKAKPNKRRLIKRSVVTERLIHEQAKQWETRNSVVKLIVKKIDLPFRAHVSLKTSRKLSANNLVVRSTP